MKERTSLLFLPAWIIWGCFLLSLARLQDANGAVDHEYPFVLQKFAFGSCAKQRFVDQPIWDKIAELHPDVFYWTGDSMYANCSSVACIVDGYNRQSSVKQYKAFAKKGDEKDRPIIDGVWDDHDFGVNDGGKFFKRKGESQDLFLDFVKVPKNHPRRFREGLYFSSLFGPVGKRVLVIALDTRFHRDFPVIPSLGSISLPFFPVLGALARALLALLGLGHDHPGDMLGEEQWEWLESTIQNHPAEATIIISSVQVFTACPLFESWGHFPRSQARLMNLLKKTKARGVHFVSGDVHFGEILGSTDGVVEITSSGLTHCCADGRVVGALCEPLLRRCPANRLDHRSDAYYTYENFGLMNFEWSDAKEGISEVAIRSTVRDINGTVRLEANTRIRQDEDPLVRLRKLDDLTPLITKKPLTARIGICLSGMVIVSFLGYLIITFLYYMKSLVCRVGGKNRKVEAMKKMK